MQHSLDALTAVVRYHHRDLVAEATRARLARATKTRRLTWLTRRDAVRLRAEVAELINDPTPHDSPQWSLPSRRPHRAGVR